MIHTVRILTTARLGRRGGVLLALAFVDLVYGYALVNPADEQARSSAYLWRDHIMPTEAWGVIWIVVGVTLALNAFLRRDRVGYALAVALKMGWAAICLASFVVGHVPQGYLAAAYWLAMAVIAMIVAGLAEPAESRQVTVLSDQPTDSDGPDL